MSTRDVLSIGGAVVGSFFGMPQLGYMAGSLLGSLVDRPDGPDPGDLSAPQINAGTAMVRGYGTFKVALSPIWLPDFVATEGGGGKGASEPTSLGYTIDPLYFAVDVTNVVVAPRIWVNKKLEYSALAASDTDTLSASASTAKWSSFELRSGGSAQLPSATYEAAVGTANAAAQRGYTSMQFVGLDCGGSKSLPLLEVELSTSATQATVAGPLEVKVSDATGTTASWPADYGLAPNTTYTGALVDHAASAPWKITCDVTVPDNPVDNVIGPIFLRYGYVVEDWALGFYGTAATLSLDLNAGTNPDYTMAVNVAGTSIAIEMEMSSGNPGTLTVKVNGALMLTLTGQNNGAGSGTLIVGTPSATYISGTHGYTVNNVVFWAPSAMTAWTPQTVTLSSIIDAELARNEAIDLADWDTSLCDAIDVRGYKCTGPPAESIAKICEIFFVDLVPGNPMRFVPRGEPAVATLENEDAGVAVNDTGKTFSGLKENNDDEQPAVTGMQYPDAYNNHDPGFERSDRLQPETTSGKNVSTFVGLIPSEAKGRAIAFNLLRQTSRFTAEVAWSDRHAYLEAGDAVLVPDEQGNLYDLLARSITYADGVHQAKVELNDVSALVYTGTTIETDVSAITVVPPMGAEAVYIDGPILREADNDAGAYSAVRGDTAATFPGAQIRRSSDNIDFSATVATHTTAATLGTVTAALPATYRRWRWDEYSTLTVDLGSTGQTLASSTKAAMQADRSINLAAVGVHGRWVYLRFRTATLVSTGVYTLSGLLLGLYGTESHLDDSAIGDDFVLASTAWRRLPGEVVDLGALRYLKAVVAGQIVASVTSEAFTNQGVGRLPYAPTRLTAARDGSNNITFSWLRRTRAPVRYGGAGGTYAPLFEDSEAYEIDVYSSSGYTTVLRTISATGTSAAYSAAEQTADGLTPGNAVYARVYQLSAQVGRGNYLQAAA